ncbi:MAG: hypothetical protein U9Q63_01430, partial [Patescibacteria group bacterium]|nr:hypothetical protein [Patescibacteria group bacterium]
PPRKRDDFITWLYDMEYKEHKLPKEDIVIYLYVPVKKAQVLIGKKGKRGYTKGKDEAEKDVKHQKKSIEMYKNLCKRFKHWQMIKCVDKKGNLLSIEQVNKLILEKLRDKKIIV